MNRQANPVGLKPDLQNTAALVANPVGMNPDLQNTAVLVGRVSTRQETPHGVGHGCLEEALAPFGYKGLKPVLRLTKWPQQHTLKPYLPICAELGFMMHGSIFSINQLH